MATYRALLSLKSSLDDPDSRLSALRLLNLFNNVFNRTFPPELSNLTNLRVLDLYNNNLTGVLHVCLHRFHDNKADLQAFSESPDELVDLVNLHCPKNDFVEPRFFLIGKLNIASFVNFDSFQSVVRSMWHLSTPVEVQARGDRFLFTFTNKRDVTQIWVDIHDLPVALTTSATARLVRETIDPVLQVDERGINNELVRVRLTLPLHDLVRLERTIRVSPEDLITVKFRYERLLGRCRDCTMINHGGGLPCPSVKEPPSPVVSLVIQPAAPPMMVFLGNTLISLSVPQVVALATPKEKISVSIREVPDFPSPSKITVAGDGNLNIVRTEKSPNKMGRPRGSKNKKPKLTESPDSMAPGPVVEEKADAAEPEED
ncbi:hypothetical protein ACLB2K_029043 [Fragaria x ananassa]